jgi:ornithine carbamoyltransferase
MIRHFIDLEAIPASGLHAILTHAAALKAERRTHGALLAGRSVAMIFEKPSTRTRLSFEVGIHELGGHPLVLSAGDMQLGRGESIADTARVLSRYADAVMMRTTLHEKLIELAAYATIPVINGLSELSHPCQIMADLLTVQERFGRVKDLKIMWAGDGNNVLNSWISAAPAFGFALYIACPESLRPDAGYVMRARALDAEIHFTHSLAEAAAGADVVVTDTWVSMGHENSETRRQQLAPYQIDDGVMMQANKEAIFLHCLPAHRGEEVTASVIDGAQSAVWDEAENRLHVQKAILCWCMHP